MTDCSNALMRDALPDLLHDRLTPGEREACAAHVAGCADCTAELAVLRSAQAVLGRAPAVDVASIVRALPPARRPVPVVPPSMRRPGWGTAARWRAAAALVLVAGGGWFAATRATDQPVGVGVASAPTDVAGPAAPAESIRAAAPTLASGETVTGERARSSESGLGVSVEDLSDDELEAVYRAMGEAEALPPVEPLPSVIPIGVEGDA
jgi:anti-sigma factor RsiW